MTAYAIAVVQKWTWRHEVLGLRAAQAARPEASAVPRLLTDGTDENGSWLVTPFYEGTVVAKALVPDEVFESLARLHVAYSQSWTDLAGIPVVDAEWWRGICLSYALGAVNRQAARHPSPTLRRARSVLEAMADDARVGQVLGQLPRSLLHGDVHTGNILVATPDRRWWTGGALADAVRWGRLARNPADQADPPRAANPEMSIWTPGQLRAFLDSVRSDRLFAAWLTAATTGMRRGEVLGLRWSDLNLDAATLSVRQIRTVARYQVLTLSPKTEKGTRTIALDPQTVAALRAYRVTQIEEQLLLGADYANSADLVFTREDGAGIHPERFSASFKQRCRKSGLPVVRLHDVRHSYVTALLAEGVPLKVVSQRIGHPSPIVTMTVYQHVLPGDDRAAAAVGARAILGDG